MTDLVSEVESVTGMEFESLSNRQIWGALMAISAENAGMDGLTASEEFIILPGDYKGYDPAKDNLEAEGISNE